MRLLALPLNRSLSVLMMFAALTTACGCGGDNGGGGGGGGNTDLTTVEPFVLKGTVKTTAGAPLAGVQVMADDTMRYNAHTMSVTDANGAFRIELDANLATSYRALATLQTEWDGQQWTLSLEPDTSTAFAGRDGAIRHFTWVLGGEAWDGTVLGGVVAIVRDLDDPTLDPDRIEVDFVPAGPLIDGSTGEPFTIKVAEGSELQGVPLGHYTVTARDVGENPVPFKVRVRNTGAFAPSVEASFESRTFHGYLEVEVSSL